MFLLSNYETYLEDEVWDLAIKLGIPCEEISKIDMDNWRQDLEGLGAKTECLRDLIHASSNPALQNLTLMVPGAQLALIARTKGGKLAMLVHVRNNGEKSDSEKEIGFPGGACNVWSYHGKVIPESFALTAYREFAEEVGKPYTGAIQLLDFANTTVEYHDHPCAYANSTYFFQETDYEKMVELASGKASEEGRIKIILADEVRLFKVFEDAKGAFRKILGDA